MPNEIRNLAYCPSCSKNVPHFRKTSVRLKGLLTMLRIGPWYCLQCEEKRLILPTVRKDAAEFQIEQLDEPVGSNKPEVWSPSKSAVSESSEDRELAVAGGSSGQVRKRKKSLDHSFVNGSGSVNSNASQKQNNRKSQIQQETKVPKREPVSSPKSSVSLVDDERSTVVDLRNLRPPITLEEPTKTNTAVSGSKSHSEQNGESQSEEMPEAEPVGNFIKDQSLVLKSTRLHRFTEKYRDSVVDRILAGKVSISSLTADGEFWEAELESWIADKAKRQEQRNKILELNADPKKS